MTAPGILETIIRGFPHGGRRSLQRKKVGKEGSRRIAKAQPGPGMPKVKFLGKGGWKNAQREK